MIECPKSIETGEPIVSAEAWARLSEAEQQLAVYHNTPHRQKMAKMYAAMARHDGG